LEVIDNSCFLKKENLPKGRKQTADKVIELVAIE